MYTEIKYLNLLSIRLEKFKQKKPKLWNCRCPICGDSQRNKTKARGFFYESKGELFYKCHNCGYGSKFSNFLKQIDGTLYSQYRLEKFKDSNTTRIPDKVVSVVKEKPVFNIDIVSSLTAIQNLNNSHPAREYLLNRRLPLDGLYWTDNFKEWTNSVKPDAFPDTNQDEGRIIIPFKDKEGVTFGFQGRSLGKTGLRYITILLQEEAPKIFGLNTVNYDKPVYITEGPFDSLFPDNAVAMAGSDADVGTLGWRDYIWVYDNEPRNRQIVDRIAKHIGGGDKVVIWPSDIRQKDINDMVLAGIDVQNIVQSNTYKGLTATLKFNQWRK